ncbi:MAG TPA: trans-aconitate 2-methyltransferase [Caulobacteraceae bacterium]|jgi:trans-aconitate 2-methyltransferase
MSNHWDPKTYLAFADERTRPAAELLARVPIDDPGRVIDLGCGPGNSTALLADRWPGARLEGVDSSPEMIRQARESGVRAEWSVADIADWTAGAAYDVIYSNAALQWVGGQASLLPRLLQAVRPGGALAFQVPLNFDMPSHALMREVAGEGSWAAKLREVRNIVLMSAEQSFDILEPYAAGLDIWETEYLQVMDGPDAIYRWVSGTGLRPFMQALDGAEREAFVEAYKARLSAAYPMRASGKTLFPFRRLFVVARR